MSMPLWKHSVCTTFSAVQETVMSTNTSGLLLKIFVILFYEKLAKSSLKLWQYFIHRNFFQWFSCTSYSRRWVEPFLKIPKYMRDKVLIPCITLFRIGCRNSGNYWSNLQFGVSRWHYDSFNIRLKIFWEIFFGVKFYNLTLC